MIIVISWLGCLKGSYIRLSEGKIWMKNFMYTNCTLLNEDIFLIGHLGGFPARMHSDGNIDYYDMMQGFVEKETGVVIDFMDYFQNKVYALDSKEGNLIIFNLQKQECKYIPLGCRYKSLMNFAVFERYGSDYYIFPKHENSFFIFDTNEEKIRKIKNCPNWWDKIQCACRVKDSIWILSGDTETLWCYYLSDGEIKVYGLERTIKDCVHAFYDGEAIFFLNRYGIIYIWDINKNEMSEITDLETEHIECESVSRIIHAGNRLILLPASGNDIKILDLETEKAEIYQDYPKDFIFEKEQITDHTKLLTYDEAKDQCNIMKKSFEQIVARQQRKGIASIINGVHVIPEVLNGIAENNNIVYINLYVTNEREIYERISNRDPVSYMLDYIPLIFETNKDLYLNTKKISSHCNYIFNVDVTGLSIADVINKIIMYIKSRTEKK